MSANKSKFSPLQIKNEFKRLKLIRNQSNRVYQPNLVPRRINHELKTSKSTPIRQGQTKRNSDCPKKCKDNLIQTKGLFSEGVGKLFKPLFRQEQYEEKISIDRPHIKSCDNKDIANLLVSDDLKIKDLLGNKENLDFSIYQENFAPQLLKLADLGNSESLSDILTKTETKFILLQFPSVSYLSSTCIQDGKSQADQFYQTEQDTKTLHEMDDGIVGKLIRYKSGKVVVSIFGSKFRLNLGLTTHPTNLISLEQNEDKHIGQIYNLGKVDAKLICLLPF